MAGGRAPDLNEILAHNDRTGGARRLRTETLRAATRLLGRLSLARDGGWGWHDRHARVR